ncbi:MAG: hypothetical protein FRX49_09952 [Trebouxia sp. A1-2]|nr:MAG: hypothetical protein FRX49_09952 [Trebouxia sp. A1-2]
MTSKVLSGVVALVSFRPDGTFNFKQTISTKLTDLGARVTSRFSKDVTHVVFQKRLKPTPEQQLAEASDLRALYDKAAKEQKYTLQRPTDADLLQPSAGITPGSSGRKRPRRTMQPKDTKELELDVTDAMYSSSQQINGQQKPGWDVGEVCSPALSKHDQRQKGQQALTKYIRHDSSRSRAGKRQQHKPTMPTDHLEVPDEDSLLKVKPVKAAQSISAALSRQTRKKVAAKDAPAFIAVEAADVLTVNLRHACHTGKRKRQDGQLQSDNCCTPDLSTAQTEGGVKGAARSSGSRKVHPKTTGKQVFTKAANQVIAASGSIKRSMTASGQGHSKKKTRLAASTPAADAQAELHHEEKQVIAPDVVMQGIHDQLSSAVVPDSDDEDMPEAGPSDLPMEGTDQPPLPAGRGKSRGQLGQGQGEVHSTVPVLLPGGSSRFSTRHLKQKVEAKLPVSRATPIGLPPTPCLLVTQQAVPIPVPEFTKVISPWTSTPRELSQPFLCGQQLPPGCVPPSAEMDPPRAATSCNAARHSQAATADGGHQRGSAAGSAGLESAVPAAASTTAAPWSACRLWDPNPIFASGPEGQRSPDDDQNQHQQQQPQQTDRNSRFRQVQHSAEPSRDGSDAAAAHDDTVMLEADDEEDGEADQACTTSGCLGLSCVEPEVQELARNAVRALRGVRLCAEGHEEGRLTHLVLGQQRRTLKVLLAIAAGAVLVTPDWLTASLEAGEWLPEAPFLAQGRFAQAALAAREVQSSDRPQPLHGKKVYVHVADAAKKAPSTGNGGPLRRLVAALGGKIVGARACNLCIVSGGCSRPANLSPDITAVREEWLLKGAEKYKLESERVHAVK